MADGRGPTWSSSIKRRGRPLMVLDTKYKLSDDPSPDDVQQVVIYAKALGEGRG